MMEQIDLQLNEPRTHTCHSHWREWLCCQDYRLTKEQLKQFYDYFRECNMLFENNQRWDLIDSLHRQYFGQPVQREGRHWLRLGFQGNHPETDFRGGGIFSLKIIYEFVRQNKKLVEIMQKDKGGFFFAVTTINIVYFLKKYFHLADFLIPGRDENEYCNRRALKNFCQIILRKKHCLEEMNKIFLTYFYNNIWVDYQKKNCEKELLDFNMLFEELKIKVRTVFENYSIGNFEEFKEKWREVSR